MPIKKVAILTDFYSIDCAYSLAGVAGNQIKMLTRGGYDPLVLVDEHFETNPPPPWDNLNLFRLPSIPRSNKLELPDGWEDHLEKMTNAMREGLEGIDVAISHDLIYQPAQILYHMAARKVTTERDGTLHWLHWVHSATTPALLNSREEYLQSVKRPFPHAFVVFPNEYSRARVARNFNYPEDKVKFVPHATDLPVFLGFQDITRKLIDEKGMLGADVVMVYPVRLDRGKQVEFPIRIAAQLKQLDRSVRFICADFHSTGGDKVVYRKWLKELSANLGLSDIEVTFTSEYDESLHVRCPSAVIRDLMLLSNVFVQSSRSETYSLIAQEAALCGNLMILNHDFPPIRSVYGEDPLYFKFSSNVDAMTGFDGDTNVDYHPNVDAYCRDIALRIVNEIQTNRVLHLRTWLRKKRNIDSVFRDYLEPLLYAWSG